LFRHRNNLNCTDKAAIHGFFRRLAEKKEKNLARLGGFLHGRTVGGTGRRRIDRGGLWVEYDPQDL
jgi:hypothetical protein